jgi:hypothetical protein
VNPPTDLQQPVAPLDSGIINPSDELTREELLAAYTYLLERWVEAALKAQNWIDWCKEEEFCATTD